MNSFNLRTRLNTIFIIIIILTCFVSFSYSKDEDTYNIGEVITLTDENFEETISKNKYVLVDFYLPWCISCSTLEPNFKQAAQILAGKSENFDESQEESQNGTYPEFLFAKIDCKANKGVKAKYKISKYPTIFFFTNEKIIPYTGGRMSGQIVTWLKRYYLSPVREVKSTQDVEMLKKTNDIVFMLFRGTDKDIYDAYELAARNYSNKAFGHCDTNKCLKDFKANENEIVVFREDGSTQTFKERYNETYNQDLNFFLFHFFISKVMKYDQKTAELIFEKRTPGVFFILATEDEDKLKEVKKVAYKVAEKYYVSLNNKYFSSLI